MSKFQKLLLTLLVVGIAGSLAGFGVFSAFSSTTSNTGNQFTAGNVNIGDNDGGSTAMFNAVTGGKPGTTIDRCIRVNYTGNLDANVRFYLSSGAAGSLSQYVDLVIQPVTFGVAPAFPDCTGASNDGAALYTGTLANFRDTKNSYANGVVDFPGAGTKWVNTDAVYYKFSYTVQDTDSAQGLTTGTHDFTWEARNQ
jgi:predicted ribosomally synthesized peptide with SipW-like signal peptide